NTNENGRSRNGRWEPPSRVLGWHWQTVPGARRRSPISCWLQPNRVEAAAHAADTTAPFRSRVFAHTGAPGDKARAYARDPAPMLCPAHSALFRQYDCLGRVLRVLREVLPHWDATAGPHETLSARRRGPREGRRLCRA